MLEIKEIREDLKDIRYYYSRKKLFDEGYTYTGQNELMKKVKIYNDIAIKAKARLYDLYVSVYIKNHTQISYADELGYTFQYVQMLHNELLSFLQKNLDKKEGAENEI